MSEWIKCSERMPESQTECLVYRKWHGQELFSIELDCWEPDSTMDGGGFWFVEESHVDWVETVADGPGHCERPITSHWIPLPTPPAEGE